VYTHELQKLQIQSAVVVALDHYHLSLLHENPEQSPHLALELFKSFRGGQFIAQPGGRGAAWRAR
jgi:hypothetical protein